MKEEEESDNYEQLYKIIIIGDSGVGKSNILGRYLNNEFREDTKSTVGVEFGSKRLMLENIAIKLQIWDTAGQERYRAITSAYYKGSKGCFIVYDITNKQSFDDIQKWYEEIKRSGDKDISIILVGNKCDLEKERKISSEMAKNKAKEMNCAFYETSALSNIMIKDVFKIMCENIYNKIKNEKIDEDDDDEFEIVKEDNTNNVNINVNNKPEKKCCK